ncbi:hypothetical protein WJX81_006579 [Elliptochloris bilobata]|uniref:KIF-binding protein n=1 Tax=Elliptochloris bilobata TaxID=381761 RepID=A0AAW1SGS8_9CHLO
MCLGHGAPRFLLREADGYNGDAGQQEESEARLAATAERLMLEAAQLLTTRAIDHAEYLLADGVSRLEAAAAQGKGAPSAANALTLAAVLFLRARLPQAEAAARRCLALLQKGAPSSGGRAGGDAAAAVAKLRLGAILMGQGRPGDAAPLLAGAANALRAFGAAGSGPAGEARFYEALSAAGYAAASEADVQAAEPAMREGLQAMRRNPAVGPALATAAMGAHQAALEAATGAGEAGYDRAEWLFRQAVRLHKGLRAQGAAARAQLQLATLRFVRGAADEAAELCRASLAGAQGAPDADRQQVALCEHRLATIAAAAAVTPHKRASDAEAAAAAATRGDADTDGGRATEQALQQSWEHWERLLGADSALAAEAQVYLALLRLARAWRDAASANPFERALAPKERASARRDLAAGLAAMGGFGEGHALCRFAQRVVDASGLTAD